jgi:hypothetical protein
VGRPVEIAPARDLCRVVRELEVGPADEIDEPDGPFRTIELTNE